MPTASQKQVQVTQTGATASNTVSATWSPTTVAGNTLIAFFTYQGTKPAGATTISGGGTWTAGPTQEGVLSIAQVLCWYNLNASAQSGTVTVTFGSAATKNAVLWIVEVQGVTASPIDQSTSAQAQNVATADTGTTAALTTPGETYQVGMLAHRSSTPSFAAPSNSFALIGTEQKTSVATASNNIAAILIEKSVASSGGTTANSTAALTAGTQDVGGILFALTATSIAVPARRLLLGVGV